MNVIIGITDSSGNDGWVGWDQIASDNSGNDYSPDDGISIGDQRHGVYIDDEVVIVDRAMLEGLDATNDVLADGIEPPICDMQQGFD